MSVNITFDGQPYIVPETGEVGWGGNTTSYLVAIAAGCLQKTGGSFTLSAETDFGASFGLQSLYYKSRTASIAAAGIIRLANNSDSISWRNAANSSDLPLLVNSSNQLTFNGTPLATSSGGTVNLGTQFQLGYYATSDTEISGLPLITGSRALESDANGLPVASAVTAAELGYLSGVTSAIQTQIDSKADDNLVVHLAGTEIITGEKTFSDGTTNFIKDFAGITQIVIENTDNTDGALSGLTLTGRSATITGSIRLQKSPPADTGTLVSGLALDNTFLVTPVSDTISRMIFDLATSTNGIYFSGGSANEYVQIDNAGHIAATSTTNQLTLGFTNTVTLSAPAPASSRTVTIPDPGANADFVMTQGAQTIVGNTTISALLPTLAANLVAGGFKATGLGEGDSAGDSVRFEQLKILQVVDGTSSTNFSTTSSSFVDTNLTATITPSSTSSKILILAFGVGRTTSPGTEAYFTIERDSTNLGNSTNGFQDLFYSVGSSAVLAAPVVMGYIDSPATTSATTYTVQCRSAGGGTVEFGRGSTQVIVLVEINDI